MQVVFLHPDLSRLAYLSSIDLTISEMLQTPEVFSCTPSFTWQRKLAIFLGGRSTIFIFCLGSILLMQSKVVLVYGAQHSCFWL
jgi:hypothetical protein